MSKKRKITLAIVWLISMLLIFPLAVTNQKVKGIAADSQGYMAVAVDSVYFGELSYIYVYSGNGKLHKKVWLDGFRGGIGAIKEENDLISIYYHGSKYNYDFDGVFLSKEAYDGETPLSIFECKSDNAEFIYSKNQIGYESVKKHTDNGKSKTVFNGIALYIMKILQGLVVSVCTSALIYKFIFPKPVWDFSKEDLREIDAKLHEWLRERKKNRKK